MNKINDEKRFIYLISESGYVIPKTMVIGQLLEETEDELVIQTDHEIIEVKEWSFYSEVELCEETVNIIKEMNKQLR